MRFQVVSLSVTAELQEDWLDVNPSRDLSPVLSDHYYCGQSSLPASMLGGREGGERAVSHQDSSPPTSSLPGGQSWRSQSPGCCQGGPGASH